jgi:MFS family permease
MFGVAYAFATTMLGTTLPTPLYPIYQQHIGFSSLIVTVVFATYAVGVLAALLVVGPLSDIYGRRRVLLPGLLCSAASAGVFLLANGLAPLFVGRLLSGFSAGIFTGTATAAIVELAPEADRGRATLIATFANIGGLGLGPLLAGILAQVAPDPLRLPYVVDLAVLLPAFVAIWKLPQPARASSPRPGARLKIQRLSVPPQVRAIFIRAATAAFASFAVLGLFTAVAPAFLGQLLHLPSHALTGVVVFIAFAGSTGGQLSLERVSQRLALPIGCASLIAGMALIAASIAGGSLALMIAGAVLAGFGNGLSLRAGLAAINAQTPPERRGEVNSSFFVVAYLAISLPIIGVGVAAQSIGLRAAGLVFSGLVAALALAVLLSLLDRGGRWKPASGRSHAVVDSSD